MKEKTVNILFLYAGLSIIFLFIAISNHMWLRLDAFPFGADELGHLENGMTVSRILKDPLRFFTLDTIFPHKWGPLHYLVSAILALVFGYTHMTFMMTGTVFFIILLTVTFFIGRSLKNAQTGLLASFILSMYPVMFHFSRKYSYEMAMAATAAFSIFCLIKAGNFEKRRGSLLLGLSMGLGFLSGPRYFLFIIGPLALVLGKYFTGEKRRHRSYNIFLMLGVAFLISLLWYFNKADFFMKINRYLVGPMDVLVRGESDPYYYTPRVLFSLENIIFHIRNLTLAQIYPFFGALFVLGLFILARNGFTTGTGIVMTWLFVPYAIFIFIEKCGRFTIQYLPALAIITSLGIMGIRTRLLKVSAVILIVVIGLSQYLYFSYGDTLFSNNDGNTAARAIRPLFDRHLVKMIEPVEGKTDWSREVVDRWPDTSSLDKGDFNAKLSFLTNADGETKIFLISDPWTEYVRVLEYFARMNSHHAYLDSRFETALFHPIHPTELLEDFLSNINGYDIIIFLSRDRANKWPEAGSMQEEIISTRSERWPPVADSQDLKLNDASLRMLQDAKKDFELNETIYVENNRFFTGGMYINLYARRDREQG